LVGGLNGSLEKSRSIRSQYREVLGVGGIKWVRGLRGVMIARGLHQREKGRSKKAA